jgi:hypothetical protein
MKLLHGDSAGRKVSERIAGGELTTTTVKAIPPNRRVGSMLVVASDSTLWCFDADSVLAAAANVLVPDAGGGRWLRMGSLTADAPLAQYSNATRPAASSVPAGTLIDNTDDNAPNKSDGTNWRDMMGAVT